MPPLTTAPNRRCDLSPGEQLRLWRGRMLLTRPRAAALVRSSVWTWGEYERGERAFPRDLPWHGPEALTPRERCLVHRLRSGRSQADVAASLGRSRAWVLKMEQGSADCADLLWYWES